MSRTQISLGMSTGGQPGCSDCMCEWEKKSSVLREEELGWSGKAEESQEQGLWVIFKDITGEACSGSPSLVFGD